jgi:hypothetical protein
LQATITAQAYPTAEKTSETSETLIAGALELLVLDAVKTIILDAKTLQRKVMHIDGADEGRFE